MSGGRLQFPTFENGSDLAMPSDNSALRGSPAAKTAGSDRRSHESGGAILYAETEVA